jgi:hypothetical protein
MKNRYRMVFAQTSTLTPNMHQKVIEQEKNNQLPIMKTSITFKINPTT